MLTLEIQKREKTDSLAELRSNDSVPAIFYGPQENAASISLNLKAFTEAWAEAGGSAIVALKGVGEDKEALIQDVVLHPVSGKVLHADFYVIERGKKLTVTIPLEYVGEAPAEKVNGIVVKILHEVEIDVRPSDIPQSIEVDLSKLVDLTSTITVGDLNFPESADVSLDSGEAVASVSEQKDEPEEQEEERTIDDVEVEEKGKKEEAEEGASEESEE